MRELCRRTNKEYTKYCLAYSLLQSPSSVWRTTIFQHIPAGYIQHFNPRPPCGGRRSCRTGKAQAPDFNPRPPCGGRQRTMKNAFEIAEISIHVLRVEDDQERHKSAHAACISIHVLHVEDDFLAVCLYAAGRISIHVLHVEDDEIFLIGLAAGLDFNPRPPCGGRPGLRWTASCASVFQSTSSMWRTTQIIWQKSVNRIYFNPRPPCGGRPFRLFGPSTATEFQSTSSMWRTT